MKSYKNILFVVLAVIFIAGAIAFAETSRLGNRFPVTFNATKVVNKTAAYTVTSADSQVNVTCSSANITITLPSINDVTSGGTKAYKIQKKDATSYKVVVTPATGETVGWESTRYLLGDEDYIIISASGGTNWSVDYESPYLVEDHEAGTYTTGIGSGGLYTAKTASATLTASECGNVVSMTTGTLELTLPATVANCKILFINNTTSQQQKIIPNSADAIWGTVESTASVYSRYTFTQLDGNAVINTGATAKPGDNIELIGDGSVGWIVTRSTGSWTR